MSEVNSIEWESMWRTTEVAGWCSGLKRESPNSEDADSNPTQGVQEI